MSTSYDTSIDTDKDIDIEEMAQQIYRRYQTENHAYLQDYLRKTYQNFPDYQPFSHPARDGDNRALLAWYIMAQYAMRSPRVKLSFAERLKSQAREAKAIAQKSKFAEIIS